MKNQNSPIHQMLRPGGKKEDQALQHDNPEPFCSKTNNQIIDIHTWEDTGFYPITLPYCDEISMNIR
jgi:hypothetical protein